MSLILHVSAALALVSIASHLHRVLLPAADVSGPIVMVHLAEGPPSASLEQKPASTQARTEPSDDLGIHLPDGDAILPLPGFDFDYRKVVKRAGALFPFLTGRVSLDRIMSARARQERDGLVNPLAGRTGSERHKPDLMLSEIAMQALLDRCWSRRERWRAFQPIAGLARSYDGTAGALPVLLNRYGTENGLQPYADAGIRDPRLWAQLGLAADHLDFIDFISGYAAANGSSRSTTELLFLLDKLVQASFDALVVLLDSDPVRDLEWTRGSSRDAFRAIVAIRDYYTAFLDRLGLTSRDALRAYYGAARLAVLDAILETTPDRYRSSDARFEEGAIFWKLGKRDDAVRIWREMTIVSSDNEVTAYSEILDELRQSGGATPDPRAVNRILQRHQSRWIGRSYDRLRRFGYHFDTF